MRTKVILAAKNVRFVSDKAASHLSSFPVIRLAKTTDAEVAARNKDINKSLYQDVTRLRHKVSTSDSKVKQMDRASRKLTVNERLALLKDEGAKVLELSPLAGLGMAYGDVYNASVQTAITRVSGQLCLIAANDWTIKGGTIYPITLKKQLRAQEIAMQNYLPCLYIADSGGAFLPLQAEIFPDKEHGGRIFRNQAVMSSLGIPQISLVCGPCTAGGAYIPTMSDEAVMVKGVGSLYLGGPPLVKAATGENVTTEELGGADVHCSISGCTDYFSSSEEEGLLATRSIVASLNLPIGTNVNRVPTVSPLYPDSEDSFAELIPHQRDAEWPIMEIIARLVDGSQFHIFKERFGGTLVTGFATLGGFLVGMLANNGPLTAPAALKGAHFIRVCTLRGIPMVFLQNTPSDSEFLSPSGNDGETVKARGRMMATLACSRVPKITVNLGDSYGPSSYAMCGRSMQPNFLFAWPHSRVAVAHPQHIIEAMGQQHTNNDKLMARLSWEESQFPSFNLANDGLILPHETRQVLIQCLEICLEHYNRQGQTFHQNEAAIQGIIRM